HTAHIPLHLRLSSFPTLHPPHTCPPHTPPYPLSLHYALPISFGSAVLGSCLTRLFRSRAHLHIQDVVPDVALESGQIAHPWVRQDRKRTRLNSSHEWISYAVFCLIKKKFISTTYFRCLTIYA